jgi:hypothetical protein
MHGSQPSEQGDGFVAPMPTPATTLATIAIAGMVFYPVSAVALHFLRPDTGIVETAMSAYAVGDYGFLETIAFVADGVAILALAGGLRISLNEPARSRMGLILLGLVGVGRLLEAAFPTDVPPGPVPRTPAGVVHLFVAFAVFVSVAVAAAIISGRVWKDPAWHGYRRPAMALAWASAATLGLFLLQALLRLGAGHYFGLFEKLFLVTWHVWVLTMAIWLRSFCGWLKT